MKILHVIVGLEAGGAENMLYKLLSNMDNAKFKNAVASMKNQGFFSKKIEALNIPVYYLNMNKFPHLSVFKYFSIVKKFKPDVIQGWMYHANVFTLLLKPFFPTAKYYGNIRTALDCGARLKNITKAIVKINSFVSKHNEFIIYNSNSSLSQHIAIGFNEKNAIFIPNGFDEKHGIQNLNIYLEFRRLHHLSRSCKIVGMFARYHPVKNHEGFLHVCKKILDSSSEDWRFVLAGKNCDYKNKELKSFISKYKLNNYVILLGHIDTNHYLQCLDVYLSTSITEGFPNIIAEAMISMIPCVATDVGECKNIINEFGFTAQLNDINSLSKYCIEALSFSSEKRIQMRNSIYERYSINSICNQYEKLYECL